MSCRTKIQELRNMDMAKRSENPLLKRQNVNFSEYEVGMIMRGIFFFFVLFNKVDDTVDGDIRVPMDSEYCCLAFSRKSQKLYLQYCVNHSSF